MPPIGLLEWLCGLCGLDEPVELLIRPPTIEKLDIVSLSMVDDRKILVCPKVDELDWAW